MIVSLDRPFDSMAAWLRCSFLIYRIFRHREFNAVKAIAFPRAEEIPAENIYRTRAPLSHL